MLRRPEGPKHHNDGQRPSIIRNPRNDPALKGRHYFEADFLRYDLVFTLAMGVVLAGLDDAALCLVSRDGVPCFDVTSLQD
jgi:hypothetical protein